MNRQEFEIDTKEFVEELPALETVEQPEAADHRPGFLSKAILAGTVAVVTAAGVSSEAAFAAENTHADSHSEVVTATGATVAQEGKLPSDDKPPAPAIPSEKRVGFVAANQPNEVWCGPAATRNAVTTAGKFPTHEELAKKEGTTNDGTDSIEKVTPVLEEYTGKDYSSVTIPGHAVTPQTEAQVDTHVKSAINNNKAVVANVKGTETDLKGVKHSYEGGHYLTVVGYGNGTVEIADPYANEATPGASPDGTYWLSTKNLTDWVAERGYSA